MDTIRQRGVIALLLAVGIGSGSASTAQAPPQNPPLGEFGSGQQRRQPNQPGGPPPQGQFGQQPFPGPGGGFGQGPSIPMGPPLGMNPIPELGKKTATILALRMIVESNLTAKEIQAALPALRELRDAEKTLKKRSEQILDDEKSALLAAKPGGPLPDESGRKLEEANRAFGEKTDQTWRAVMREVGPEKAGVLRQIIEGGMGPGIPGGFGGFAPGTPGFRGPGGQGGNFYGTPPAQPGRPGSVPGRGGQGRNFYNQQPGQRGQDGRFFQPGPERPGEELDVLPPVGEGPVADRPVPDAPEAEVQGPPPAFRPGGQGQPRGQLPPPGPGQQPNPFGGQPRPGGQGFFAPQPFMMGPRLTVSELVDLLEQRLAAMPK